MTFGSSTVSVQPIQAVTREVADSFDLGLAGISEIRAQTAALTSSVQSLLAATDLGSGDGRSPLACFVDSARLTAEAAETVAASLGDSRNVAVLAGIIENLRALRKRAVELRTISMLTKISCYRGTEDGLNIDSFVTALETWSRDLEDTVSEALSLVGLGHRLDHFPAEMSGGEQQRVAIARAIAKRPEVLLCDEPTGALDSKTGITVLQALKDINDQFGTTTAVITHNASIRKMAHRVIRFQDGKIGEVEVNEARIDPKDIEW